MALQFITGRSGSGKSHYIFDRIIRESIQNPDKQYIVLVPEQFTLQTQKDIVRLHPSGGILNIDVLSFNRLAWRIFQEMGGLRKTLLEETGKSLIIRHIVEQQKDELKILGRDLENAGAISGMKSLISELMQYLIEPDEMDDWAQGEDANLLLSGKLADIRRVYSGFKAYIQEHFLTAEEVPEALCEVIEGSRLLKGSVLALDGFTGFTPSQHQVLKKILPLADEVLISVTIDPEVALFGKGREHRLFAMSRQMARNLRELALETRTAMKPPVVLDGVKEGRFSGRPDLQFLEAHLFRGGKRVFQGNMTSGRHILVKEAENPAKEVRRIAEIIEEHVRNQGYHYKDFAIVTGDLETYGRAVQTVFSTEEIPYFLDRKQPVIKNPLVEYIRSAIDMVDQNFSYRSVFRFLRSPLSDFTSGEIDLLENYCLALGIRGRKKYEEKWIRPARGMLEEELESVNALREKFVHLTSSLTEGFRERMSSTKRKCEVLYLFLIETAIPEKLSRMEKEAKEEGDALREREYGGIWEPIMQLLEKMAEILGEERLTRPAFLEILEAGFQESSLGLVPPGEDQVLIGDLERTRLKAIRVLFLAGVNEGIVPKAPSQTAFLSESDREYLKAKKINLAPTAREEMYRQRFYLYLMLTKPSEELYLSYARAGSDGSSLLPSYLIGQILEMFPEAAGGQEKLLALETREGRQEILLSMLQKRDREKIPGTALELLRQFMKDPETRKEAEQLFLAAAAGNKESTIGERMAENLYGKEIALSATRLETYAACPFRHFLDYGLGLTERELYELDARDTGTILHEALERYARKLAKNKLTWQSVSEEERIRLAEEALFEITGDYHHTIFSSTWRNSYRVHRMKEMLHRSIWAITKQVESGSFQPLFFEKGFGMPGQDSGIRLPGETRLYLKGRIDRLDVAADGDTRYVRVIDYKSGSRILDINELAHGTQIQLMLYLMQGMEAVRQSFMDRTNQQRSFEKEPGQGEWEEALQDTLQIEPAGVFYYHIDDPIIEAQKGKDPSDGLLQALRPDGLVRSETGILKLMDKNLEPGKTSRVIPVRLKKDGNYAAGSRVTDRSGFQTLMDYTGGKVRELGAGMISGDIRISPTLYEKKTPCTFCPHRSVCGFDERIPGFGYRKLGTKKETEDVLAEMKDINQKKQGHKKESF